MSTLSIACTVILQGIFALIAAVVATFAGASLVNRAPDISTYAIALLYLPTAAAATVAIIIGAARLLGVATPAMLWLNATPVVIAAAVIVLFASVPDSPEHLDWQWPAGRAPTFSVPVLITAVACEPRDILGTRKSPSLAHAIPDPVLVTFSLLSEPAIRPRHNVVRLPRAELPAVSVGDTVWLDFADRDTVTRVRAQTSNSP